MPLLHGSTLWFSQDGMSPEDIEALRNGTYFEPKLQALHHFTGRMVQARGWVEDHEESFMAAGYGKQQVLEVILGMLVIHNYTNHIAKTPLDDVFRADVWSNKKQ